MKIVADIAWHAIPALCERFGLDAHRVNEDQAIPGTYWGEPEAGLIGSLVFVRPDTPLHSLLHEACHAICMPAARRIGLHTDAGGDFAEEDAVCYLQILLAEHLPGYDSDACMRDMDAWGYTFRLGSAAAWFTGDAEEARTWLIARNLLTLRGEIVALREAPANELRRV
ncbi:MAG: hypothetical protein ACFCUG_01085 [Thiotrichales bacterium]